MELKGQISRKLCLDETNFSSKYRGSIFISIVGPKNSGKSLLRSKIINFFTKEKINSLGLYTFRFKKKIISLFESSNNLVDILDSIKVSDIILLVVNLENGLEKDTLEAISMINYTGIVKIIVIFTNNSKKILKSKKIIIMKRLSQEFSFKFKFYDLNYDDISRICKCIDTMKIINTIWKSTHPYFIIDDSKDGYCYGYLRGRSINSNSDLFAHIPGYGDIVISKIKKVENEKIQKIKNPISKIIINEDKKDLKINKLNKEELNNELNISEDDYSENFNNLCKKAKERFKKKAITEEDLKNKFLENYTDESSEENFNETLLIKPCDGTLIVGDYCKLKVNLKYDKERLMIIGSYLVGEKNLTMLQGKIIKNKWQTKDLKTNAPYFISMGWARFQTIPVFSKDEKVIKYVRGSIGADYSEIVFYGPFVAIGTSFMIFDTFSDYRVLGNGQILNSDGGIRIKKKLKLIGYPKKIMGNNIIIQSMFSSAEEVNKFINAKLSCVSGLRGIVKRPIGKCGDFRASFEGSMLLSDIVFIKCFLPFSVIKYFKYMKVNEKYIKSLADIKREKGLPLYEESDDEINIKENQNYKKLNNEVDKKEYLNYNNNNFEINDKKYLNKIIPDKSSDIFKIKRLKRKLEFYSKDFIPRKESIDLPTPPNELKYKHDCELIEQRRKIKEAQEKTNRFIRKTEKERKRQAEKIEIEKRKKTNAIECKRSKEKGGKIKKKFNKKVK